MSEEELLKIIEEVLKANEDSPEIKKFRILHKKTMGYLQGQVMKNHGMGEEITWANGKVGRNKEPNPEVVKQILEEKLKKL